MWICNPLLVKLTCMHLNPDGQPCEGTSVYVHADDVSTVAALAGFGASWGKNWTLVIMKTGVRIEVLGTVDEVAIKLGYVDK